MDRVPNSAQHYIECDTESCRNHSEFYCNTCHQGTCALCREAHLKKHKGHDIVSYQERKRKLPSEKCRIHPTKDIDIYCDDCKDPVCSTCFALDHSDHANIDLETIYNETLQQCHKILTDISKTVIPRAQDNLKSFGEKRECRRKEIAELKLSMKNRAVKLKEAVDTILIQSDEKLDEIENSHLDDLVEQQKQIEDYINYLEKMITDYDSKMESIKATELVKYYVEISLATVRMPNISKPKLPIFTPGTLNQEEIVTQFGKIELNSSKGMYCSFSFTKVNEVTIHGINISHLSPLPSNKFWASDGRGNLIQSDMEGKILHKIFLTVMGNRGNHTVTTEGELLYSDYRSSTIYRVTKDMSINKLMSTGNWKPGAIFSSLINGHIFVGMWKNAYVKLSRYSREGRKLQDIQRDEKGQTIYQSVLYITENINADICTSDNDKVVVVTGSGEYRFSYSGHHSQCAFIPYGICTDVLGHILVCNGYEDYFNHCSSVHVLDMDGQFLFLLLTPGQCPPYLCALYIDDQNNLFFGCWKSSTVAQYKYFLNAKT